MSDGNCKINPTVKIKDLQIDILQDGFRYVIFFNKEWKAEFGSLSDADMFVYYWEKEHGLSFNIKVDYKMTKLTKEIA